MFITRLRKLMKNNDAVIEKVIYFDKEKWLNITFSKKYDGEGWSNYSFFLSEEKTKLSFNSGKDRSNYQDFQTFLQTIKSLVFLTESPFDFIERKVV